MIKHAFAINLETNGQAQSAIRQVLLNAPSPSKWVPFHRDIRGCNTPGQIATITGLSPLYLPVTTIDTCAMPKMF